MSKQYVSEEERKIIFFKNSIKGILEEEIYKKINLYFEIIKGSVDYSIEMSIITEKYNEIEKYISAYINLGKNSFTLDELKEIHHDIKKFPKKREDFINYLFKKEKFDEKNILKFFNLLYRINLLQLNLNINRTLSCRNELDDDIQKVMKEKDEEETHVIKIEDTIKTEEEYKKIQNKNTYTIKNYFFKLVKEKNAMYKELVNKSFEK